MTVKEIVQKVSREYNLSEDELLKESMKEFLLKRKSEIETDALDILLKNDVKEFHDLDKLIKEEKEHPEWEDLIVLENLHEKLKEIEDDIRSLL